MITKIQSYNFAPHNGAYLSMRRNYNKQTRLQCVKNNSLSFGGAELRSNRKNAIAWIIKATASLTALGGASAIGIITALAKFFM